MNLLNKNTVPAVPIPEDNSKSVDEIKELDRQSELRKAQANESIIKIYERIDKMEKQNQIQFVLAIIISGLTLMAAIASIIISLVK